MVATIRYAVNRWEFIYFKKESDYLHVKVGLL
jgi:hypothetical protein